MSYSLRADETVRHGALRILEKELEKAKGAVLAHEGSRKERAHEVRKRLKKVRALIRLVRQEIGEPSFRRENVRYRNLGRIFSRVRDADAMGQALETLLEHFQHQISTHGFHSVKQALAQDVRVLSHEIFDDKEILHEAVGEMDKGLGRFGKIRFNHDGWKAIEGGIGSVYRQGRRAFTDVYDAPTDIGFHEWRKQAKYLRYQLSLVCSAWKGPLGKTIEELHKLSDLLGDDHDLVQLRTTIAERPACFGTEETLQALFGLISRRQEELRSAAEPLGRRIYAEKPKAFCRRLHSYWDAWQNTESDAAARATAAGTPPTERPLAHVIPVHLTLSA